VQTTTDNVGFALPITQVKYLLKNIWDNGGSIGLGCVQRATLGINSTIYKSVAENTDKLQIKETIMISKVFGSTAAYGKLFVGDIIEYIIIGGVKYPITRNYQIGELLLQVRLGDSVKIGVLRGDNNGSQMVQKEVEIRFNSFAYFTKYA
jgi:S1-C subfamily serine protease